MVTNHASRIREKNVAWTMVGIAISLVAVSWLLSCSLGPNDEGDNGDGCFLSGPEVSLEAEELSVYALVLDSLYPEADMIVLRDSTRFFPIFKRNADPWFEAVSAVEMSADTRDAFVQANAARSTVPGNVPLSKPIEIIQEGPLPGGSWPAFFELYPTSLGIMALSRVGFGTESCEAAVYYEISCGSVCGRGEIVLLSYADSHWLITSKNRVWVAKAN